MPFVALLAGLLGPAAVAFGLISIAGTPGIDGGDGVVRRALLLVLYALMAAPIPGWFLIPLAWPVLVGLIWHGIAGLKSILSGAVCLGILAAHVLLNGDVTSEAPGTIPCLVAAFALQGLVVWRVVWALEARFVAPQPMRAIRDGGPGDAP